MTRNGAGEDELNPRGNNRSVLVGQAGGGGGGAGLGGVQEGAARPDIWPLAQCGDSPHHPAPPPQHHAFRWAWPSASPPARAAPPAGLAFGLRPHRLGPSPGSTFCNHTPCDLGQVSSVFLAKMGTKIVPNRCDN